MFLQAEAVTAAIVREYQETQQSLTMQHAATRKAQREALNGEFVVFVCLDVRAKQRGHIMCVTTLDFGLRRVARLTRKKAMKNRPRAKREDVSEVLVCANSASLRGSLAVSLLLCLVCHFLCSGVRLHKSSQMKKILPLTNKCWPYMRPTLSRRSKILE
eukprot:COSAG01_NODE_899_length_12871_cov_27.629572_2_plen_159_part_00